MHDLELTQDEEKADAFFQHFNAILGEPGHREANLNLSALNLPRLENCQLDFCFTEEEVWQVIQSIPTDKAPGPDGFTGATVLHGRTLSTTFCERFRRCGP